MRISDWSSDVCSSDLTRLATGEPYIVFADHVNENMPKHHRELGLKVSTSNLCSEITLPTGKDHLGTDRTAARSEEHTSELQSLMRISYAVLRSKKENQQRQHSYVY